SIWSYNGSSYVTYTAPPTPATTAWYLRGTTIDAGGNKTASIERKGNVTITDAFFTSEKTTAISATGVSRFYVNTPEYQGGNVSPAAMRVRMETKVAKGKTNEGTSVGMTVVSYYSGASKNTGDGEGILNGLKGLDVYYGSNYTDSKGTVNVAIGIQTNGYISSPDVKIKKMYDVYCATGPNLWNSDTKNYGVIVLGNNKKSYFAGKTGFASGIQLSMNSAEESLSSDKYTLRVNSGKLQFHDGTSWKTIKFE
ncbi:hypothetical protein D0T49_06415, partial [Paludibacter sp. 221]|uniref:hypothetical protein n=1 Tax=Paludibacter sp. 221 TaxID=2302939 RepID=UPI0013D7DAC0